MKINVFYVLVVLILSIAFTASGELPANDSARNTSSFAGSSEFCCACLDWTNFDAWLNKKKLCCDQNASLNCTAGCECLTEAEAIRKFENTDNLTYESCSKAICGCNSSGEPRYCFKGKSLS